MGIQALYVINKAGGLIYQKDFVQGPVPLSSNEYLRMAGVFHGVHTIARTIAPTKQSSGIITLEGENMQLRCFQTATGSFSRLQYD
jgi:trafficking protein particle complex subunit 4